MARTQGPNRPDEESRSFYRRSDGEGRGGGLRDDDDDLSPLDARMLDLETEEQSPFLRAQKRVPVRRGALPRKARFWVIWSVVGLLVLGVVGAASAVVYRYGARSWRFRIDSSDEIEVLGTQHVGRQQVLQVMGGDIGRNAFFVPLEERRRQIEEISWVESATVMRYLPNHLKIVVKERTPVAFVNIGSRIELIDAQGYLMDSPPGGEGAYSFPVILGMAENDPLSTRAARMKIYNALLSELDGGGAHYSQDVNEVDLSDPEDVKITVADPAGAVLIHLGSSNYLERYKVFVAHVQEWRQQFPKLDSVDLRYDRQVIVNPDLHGAPPPAPAEQEAAPPPKPEPKPKPKAAPKTTKSASAQQRHRNHR